MSLDGAFIRLITGELQFLTGGRIEKINCFSREEILLHVRKDRENFPLLLSANPETARICLTYSSPETGKTPDMFLTLLRKHAAGCRIAAIEQDGLERIVTLRLSGMSEIGDATAPCIILEIMGRRSNIILTEEKKIIAAAKHVTDDISSVRRILPGVIYTPPPRERRLLLTDFSADNVVAELAVRRGKKLSAALIEIFEGVSPLFTRECAYHAGRDSDCTVGEILPESGGTAKLDRLMFFLRGVGAAISNGDCRNLVTITDKATRMPKDFSFVNIEQYGTELVVKRFFDESDFSANRLTDWFFREKAEAGRARARAGSLLKNLMTAYERVEKKLAIQREELLVCGDRGQWKTMGDTVTANIFRLKGGESELVVYDETAGEISVPLDTRLSPAANAQKYYKEYKRLSAAQTQLTRLIAAGEADLLYLDSVFDEAARAGTDAELREIRQELAESGFLKRAKNSDNSGKSGKAARNSKTARNEKTLPPMKFRSADGFVILCGRNNKGNDTLTFRTAAAKNGDIWLHSGAGVPGAHVIIQAEKKTVPDSTVEEAAKIAAANSKAGVLPEGQGKTGKISVDYCPVKYVKKPPGAKPGMVTYDKFKTIVVTA
ncbi:fibronectin-binding protein A [Clostridia bacterium]|nr:fibronectin-binding protein A [Clostridia bacterium]